MITSPSAASASASERRDMPPGGFGWYTRVATSLASRIPLATRVGSSSSERVGSSSLWVVVLRPDIDAARVEQSYSMSADARQTSANTVTAPPAPSDRALLLVYEGEGEAATTRVIELPDGARFSIGRTARSEIHIDSDRVSREHAEITRRGLELTILDQGSRNGTWVNGSALTGSRRLASGDAIAIGPATIVVSLVTHAARDSRVHTSRELEERLAAEVDRAHTYRRAFALARLRFEGPAGDVAAALDRIAAAARTMDFVAEYAPCELAILLPELDAAAASAAVRTLVALAHVGVAAGIAAFPEHGTTADDLVASAGTALRSGDVGLPPADDPGGPTDAPVAIDPQMKRVYELASMVARHTLTVLIQGETGVGKEVIASAIHRESSRRDRPLVRLNCASLPDTLLETELFGHERGAFTGAERRKLGFFEAASGGTLFLDEIGELSAGTQAKLLRVLEARRIMRVGGTVEIEVDVRVVCATNRDLDAEVVRGAFRSDLLYRISGFTILVPPLRDRAGEILPLAEYFLVRAAGGRRPPRLSAAAAQALRRYPWPGNVRELRNAIERAYVMQQDGEIQLEDLPDRVQGVHVEPAFTPQSLLLDGARDVRSHIAELERDAIVAALEACGGSQTEAAKKLGVSRRALIYRMEKHGLKPPPPGRR